MQQTSDLYKQLLADPRHVKEVRLNVAGTDYLEDQLVELSTTAPLFSDGTLSVGGAVAKEIDVSLFVQGTVPRMAKLTPFVRLRLNEQVSEWIQKGVFYIDTRQTDESSGVTAFHGFDDMLKAEVIWEPDQNLTFPMSMRAAVLLIAQTMGVEVDNPEDISDQYQVDYPANEWTLRDVLRFCAGACGGNFVMTDLGKLRLVRLNLAAGAAFDVGQDAAAIFAYPTFQPISKIHLLVDEENEYAAGDDSGKALEITCPYGSQAMADNLLAQLQGYTYQPMTAQDALLDPAAEIGDHVTVDEVSTILAQIDTLFDMHCAADIAAPGEEELESEYTFQTQEKRLERKLAQTRSLISKTTEELLLMVEGFDGRISQLSVDVDSIEGRVEGVEGEFTSFILETNGFYVFDASGNRSAIRGSSIDTTTLNVQDINFTGVIRWNDLAEDAQDAVNEAYDMAAEAYDMADSVQLPAYIKSTYIDFTKVQSPRIEANDIGLYGGYFEIYDGSGRTKYGSLGFGSGLTTAGETTYGMVMSAEGNTDLGEEGNYFIATNAGVRMQSGGSKVFAVDGMAVLESNGNQIYVGASGADIKVGGVISAINGSGGGGGGGNMSTAVYDPTGEVAAAGGIAAFVRAVHGSGGGGSLSVTSAGTVVTFASTTRLLRAVTSCKEKVE